MAQVHNPEREALLNDIVYEDSQEGSDAGRTPLTGTGVGAMNECTPRGPFKWFREDKRRLTVFIPLAIPFILVSIAWLLLTLAARKEHHVMVGCYTRYDMCMDRKAIADNTSKALVKPAIIPRGWFMGGGVLHTDGFPRPTSMYAPECKDKTYDEWYAEQTRPFYHYYDEYDGFFEGQGSGPGLSSTKHKDKTETDAKTQENAWYCDCVFILDRCGDQPDYDGYGDYNWTYNAQKKQKAGTIMLIVSAALLLPSWLVAYGITVAIARIRQAKNSGDGPRTKCWLRKMMRSRVHGADAKQDSVAAGRADRGGSWKFVVFGRTVCECICYQNPHDAVPLPTSSSDVPVDSIPSQPVE